MTRRAGTGNSRSNKQIINKMCPRNVMIYHCKRIGCYNFFSSLSSSPRLYCRGHDRHSLQNYRKYRIPLLK